jgi:hypothetical protein
VPCLVLEIALDFHVVAQLACCGSHLVLRADSVSSCPEERAQNSDCPVVRFGCDRVHGAGGRVVAKKVHPVLLTAAQGGSALVAAGEGGECHIIKSKKIL